MATAVEYGLMAALVGVIVVAGTVVITAPRPENRESSAEDTVRGATPGSTMRFVSNDSPRLIVDAERIILAECPPGYTWRQRARPVGAPDAFTCVQETTVP